MSGVVRRRPQASDRWRLGAATWVMPAAFGTASAHEAATGLLARASRGRVTPWFGVAASSRVRVGLARSLSSRRQLAAKREYWLFEPPNSRH
jgi:hypothetical protein